MIKQDIYLRKKANKEQNDDLQSRQPPLFEVRGKTYKEKMMVFNFFVINTFKVCVINDFTTRLAANQKAAFLCRRSEHALTV